MNTTSTLSNFTEFSQHEKVHHLTAFIVLSVLQIISGSLFNGFVISLLVINHRLLAVPANVTLLSLAISDFLACAVVLPYHVYLVLGIKENAIQMTLLFFSVTLSMAGTVILTADRFLAIVYALRYNVLVTITRTRYALVCSWLFSLLYSTMFYIALRLGITEMRYLLLIVKVCGISVILLCYCVIFRAACRHIRRIKNQERSLRRASAVVLKKTLISAKRSGSIVFLFAICYLPVFCLAAYNEIRSVPPSIYNDYVIWLLCLAFFNCSVNPLLYCMFSEKLRLIVLGYWHRMFVFYRTHDPPQPKESDVVHDATEPA